MPPRKPSTTSKPKKNLIGARVKLRRMDLQPALSQEDLAARISAYDGLQMTQEMVSKIERGTRHVSDIELRAIASSLAVGVSWLIGESETFAGVEGPAQKKRGRN